MTNFKTHRETGLVRTSVLISPETDEALRRLAAIGRRPLSWEIREALEAYVDSKRTSEVAA